MTTPMRLEVGEAYTVKPGWVIAVNDDGAYLVTRFSHATNPQHSRFTVALSLLVTGIRDDAPMVLVAGRVLPLVPSDVGCEYGLTRVSSDLPLRP